MASQIDLHSSRKSAFIRGFWKGMTAPLMLFSTFDLPAEVRNIGFQPLPKRQARSDSDWVKVGKALKSAAARDRDANRG